MTTEPGLLFSERSELRTFITNLSPRRAFSRRVGKTHPDGRVFLSYPCPKMCAVADVRVRDETMTGREIESWVLPGLPDRMTARELVRLRVREEVARFDAGGGAFRGLAEPARGGPVDEERLADLARAAFARNGFVMIAGDRQVDDLDEVIDLTRAAEVAFIRLVPLAGG